MRPTARSPLHHWHAAHGARLVETDGWQVPASYSGTQREATAAQTGVALADLSAFVKVRLLGPGVADLARRLVGDGPASKPLGVSTIPGDDPALACRLTAEHLLLLASAPRFELRGADLEVRVAVHEIYQNRPVAKLVLGNATSAYAGFSLVGPRAEEVLRQLTALDVSVAAL